MAQLKISKTAGRSIEQQPGVTVSIKGIDSAEMRDEIAKALSKIIPETVQKILGEQLTIEQSSTKEDDN